MSENLLRNGSFEEGWSEAEGTGMMVYTVDSDGNPGAVEVIERPENRPPAGWTSWCLRGTPVQHDSGNSVGWSEPEVNQIHKSVDERRVADGDWALRMFTFHRIHDCGVFQRVELPRELPPGSWLLLACSVHAWSSQDDDAATSEGADGPFFRLHDPDAPLSSDLENFTLAAGIDPTGGTDPYADTVTWGAGIHAYNGHLVAMDADDTVGGSRHVTVFLRSRCLWPFKHCDAYFDDAVLIAYLPEEPTEPPESTEIEISLARIADTLEDIRDILRENASIQISGNGSGVVLEDFRMGVDWGGHNDYAVLRESDGIHGGWLSGLRRKMAGLFCG